jgi:hypothetical protein
MLRYVPDAGKWRGAESRRSQLFDARGGGSENNLQLPSKLHPNSLWANPAKGAAGKFQRATGHSPSLVRPLVG